jgi:hypothetical protein
MEQRTHSIRVISRYGACFAIALLVIGMSPAFGKEKKHVTERFQATAMDLDSGRASIVEIGIFGWNTDADRQDLIKTFQDGGNPAVYKWMGKRDEMAFVKLPNTLGYQMRYAFQYEADGKRHIILGTDRPIGMGEIMRDTQTSQDNISFVTLDLDSETGEGTGQMVFGAEFGHNKKTGQLEIETLSMNPTKFTKVKTEKVKHKG